LVRDQRLLSIEGSSPANSIAPAVAEGPDPCPAIFACVALIPSALFPTSPKFPSFAVQIDSRIDLVQGLLNVQQVLSLKLKLIRSKRNPSTLYSLAQTFSVSSMSLKNMRCSEARIRTASVHVNIAIVIEPVIVSRHHFYRELSLGPAQRQRCDCTPRP